MGPLLILIVIIVVIAVVVRPALQRAGPAPSAHRRGVRPDPGPAQAALGPHPEPRERGQGLHGLRAVRADPGDQRPRLGRHGRRPGPRRLGGRGERPHLVPPLAVRGGGELPAAQGERERPEPAGAADHDGEPDQLLAAALQRHRAGLQHVHPDASRRPCWPARWASPSASSSRPRRPPRRRRRSTWARTPLPAPAAPAPSIDLTPPPAPPRRAPGRSHRAARRADRLSPGGYLTAHEPGADPDLL